MNDCDHSTIMVDSIDELGASALLAQGVVKRMFIIFSKSLKQEMIPEKIAMDDRDIRLLRWTQNGPFSDEIWNTCIPYAYVDDDCIDEIIHSSNMLIVFDGFETEEKQKILKKNDLRHDCTQSRRKCYTAEQKKQYMYWLFAKSGVCVCYR